MGRFICCPVRALTALLLDSLFGTEEEFEFTESTLPFPASDN